MIVASENVTDQSEEVYENDKVRIILADDHGILREGLSAMLEKNENFEIVSTAADGNELARKTKEFSPDLVIADLSMPEADGINGIKQIRAFDQNVKILVLTMHKSKKMMKEAMSQGANGYLLKDDVFANLVNSINHVLAGKQFISQTLLHLVVDDYIDEDFTEKKLSLTKREREVLALVAQGMTSLQVASELNISPRTVEGHRANLRDKLEITDLAGLLDFAKKAGLV